MLVLALDTTTRAGSCAVARGDLVLREAAGDPGRPHDERLPHDLMTLLAAESVAIADIDVYAVATGPGSFTGLRIGIATMQGLAFATGKPLVGVSALDALAVIAGAPRVATWVDAWRGDVYAARYEDGREVEPPTVQRPEALLSGADAGTLFIGDGAGLHRQTIAAVVGAGARIAEPAAPLLAGAIARLAAAQVRAGHVPPPHAIRPLYVRRPDAERSRHARPVH